jgi:hypothetical protein
MKEWITVLKAADAAARWHVHQRRKGAAKGGAPSILIVVKKAKISGIGHFFRHPHPSATEAIGDRAARLMMVAAVRPGIVPTRPRFIDQSRKSH